MSAASRSCRCSCQPPSRCRLHPLRRHCHCAAVLEGCKVSNSVLGECVYVGRGSRIESSLLLGCSAWMSGSLRREALEHGDPVYGVGECCWGWWWVLVVGGCARC